jgi:hypothetical protein
MATLNEALPVYLSVGASNHPKKSLARLEAVFGRQEAHRIVGDLDALIGELDEIGVDWTQHTLASGSDWAVARLRQRHPELDDRAAQALDWYFSFSWK